MARCAARPRSAGTLVRALMSVAAMSACAARSGAAPPLRSAAPPDAALVHETRAVLEQLVAVDTSHGHESDALQPIAERFRAAGLATEVVESSPGRGNLVARYKGKGGKRPLLLIAHIDVVPVEGQPWTVPPFRVTEKEGYLWGRGVNDDKGMAAMMVTIALEMARTKPVLSRDVIFALTAGEETGGSAGAEWLAKSRKDLIDAEIALNEGAGGRLDDQGRRLIEGGGGGAQKTCQSHPLRRARKG